MLKLDETSSDVCIYLPIRGTQLQLATGYPSGEGESTQVFSHDTIAYIYDRPFTDKFFFFSGEMDTRSHLSQVESGVGMPRS